MNDSSIEQIKDEIVREIAKLDPLSWKHDNGSFSNEIAGHRVVILPTDKLYVYLMHVDDIYFRGKDVDRLCCNIQSAYLSHTQAVLTGRLIDMHTHICGANKS